MLGNNSKRLNLWLKMLDKHSFLEFEKLCFDNDITPLSPLDFAHKVGMIEAGISMFPNLSIKEAYIKYVTEFASEYTLKEEREVSAVSSNSVPPLLNFPDYADNVVIKKTTCCGGGIAR